MLSKWNVPGRSSVLQPPPFAAGEHPPLPHPSDPPDPTLPFSPQTTNSSEVSPQNPQGNAPATTDPSTGSETTTVKPATHEIFTSQNLTIYFHHPLHPLPTQIKPPQLHLSFPLPLSPPEVPEIVMLENQTTQNPLPQPAQPSLVEKIRATEDQTLQRLSPVTISPSSRHRVLIHDVVFQKGAELHKDFIICYFNGKAPPFNQIQSVFNHIWGKGQRLEIQKNPLNHSTIVRIQCEFLRHKILDKCIWYVGDSMFHMAQWSSAHSSSTPPLKDIKIWAHLTGVPLHLRPQQGLSLVAGHVGEPKETDDFTKNLVSLTLSHVKVEVDLTQPLLSVVEFDDKVEK
ncbi:hypothetical protein F2Q68_00005437 [Brassica cretica]|uniref:DUF4283 domain-containing protein n=1 Tax=Brassica cretica TaxID=69181 RepID=A0A8S9JGU6_BRACR|nr:hypothetical protein F2Q68_00005437 [Brassica cretica]